MQEWHGGLNHEIGLELEAIVTTYSKGGRHPLPGNARLLHCSLLVPAIFGFLE